MKNATNRGLLNPSHACMRLWYLSNAHVIPLLSKEGAGVVSKVAKPHYKCSRSAPYPVGSYKPPQPRVSNDLIRSVTPPWKGGECRTRFRYHASRRRQT